MTIRQCASVLVTALVLSGGGAGEATAQDAGFDSRWTPWLGCWQLWEEQFKDAEQLHDDRSIVGRTSVCMTPADTGVSLTAVVGDELLVERHLVADGTRREVREESCRGWEESRWSADGHRLFTSGEMQCDDSPTRTINGVSMMASASSWVDIQFVQFGDREQLEVRRYSPTPILDGAVGRQDRPVDEAEIRQARRASAETPVLSDVMEASEKTRPRVVEALLVETEPDLDLDAASLIALDDAGIDHGVIDLVVALSYPEHFVVERRNRGGSWSSGLGNAYGGYGRAYDPIWYGDLYPYYVTPLGYRGWSRAYNPYLYGAAASPFVILPTAAAEQGASTARALPGRGYTRVRPERDRDVRSRGSGRAPHLHWDEWELNRWHRNPRRLYRRGRGRIGRGRRGWRIELGPTRGAEREIES